MVLDEERISMKIQAMGRAVMELSLADLPMTQQNIIDKLEQYRKETGNVIGKGVNRDAAELVRKGKSPHGRAGSVAIVIVISFRLNSYRQNGG
jgi:hypothetical protein